LFRQKDWESSMAKVVSDITLPKANLLGIGENLYATRDDKGAVSVYSAEEFEKKGVAQKMGKTFSEFVRGNGWAKTGETKKQTNPYGVSTQEHEYVDLDGNRQWRTTVIDKAGKETEEDKNLREFHIDWLNEDQSNKLVKAVFDGVKRGLKTKEIIEDIIQPVFPSYKFFSEGKYEKHWYGDSLGTWELSFKKEGVQDEKTKTEVVNFIKGKKVIAVSDQGTAEFWWSVSPQGEVILANKGGQIIKDPEQIKQIVTQNNIPVPPEFAEKF